MTPLSQYAAAVASAIVFGVAIAMFIDWGATILRERRHRRRMIAHIQSLRQLWGGRR